MANGGIDFHSVDTECAIAGHGNDLPPRKCKGSGDCVRYADTKAPKGARVHIRARGETDPREAQNVPSVRNRDVVWICYISDGIKNAIWVHFSVSRDDRLLDLARLRSFTLTPPQTFGPVLVHLRRSIAGRLHQSIERQFRRRENFRQTTSIVEQFARGICNANEAGVRKNCWRSV